MAALSERAPRAAVAALSERVARAVVAALEERVAFSERVARAVLATRAFFTGGSLFMAALARAIFVTRPRVLYAWPLTLFIAAAAGLPWFTDANWALFRLAACWCDSCSGVG